MYAEERQRAIVEMVVAQGRASVVDLAGKLDVTPETIRRDLDRLEAEGLIRRVHGGALPAAAITVLEPDMEERELAEAAQKDRIAEVALTMLPSSGGSIIVDAGTTTGRLVGLLPSDADLTIVTNSVTNAARLTGHHAISLHLVGGQVRGTTQATVGPATTEHLARLRVDVVFLGTNGLTSAFGASTPDAEEAAAKQAMVLAAHQVVVLADASKFGREYLHCVAPPSMIDIVVTNAEADPDEVQGLERCGTRVVLA